MPDTDATATEYGARDCANASALAGIGRKLLDLTNATLSNDFLSLYCRAAEPQRVCFEEQWTAHPPLRALGDACEPHWDNVSCWPAAQRSSTARHSCPNETGFEPDLDATRRCGSDGSWDSSDYSPCISSAYLLELNRSYFANATADFSTEAAEIETWRVMQATVVKDIYFYGSCASLLMLLATLVIFCWLRSLRCARVHIHKNLVISLILHCVLTMVYFEPYIGVGLYSHSYPDKPDLCKVLTALVQYTLMTNVFWTFVEGLYMYCKIAVAVFSKRTPYLMYHLIGWGMPAVCVIVWTLCMANFHEEQTCWRHYSASDYHWIIVAPIIMAVVANLFFLINIMKVLIRKLNSACSPEHRQIRKAMKATGVLLPLLSITNIIFVSAPSMRTSPEARMAYSITNAVLQTTQGMLVATLYCFFNGEVRTALVRRLRQLRDRKKSYDNRCKSFPQSADVLLKKYISASTVLCVPTETGSCYVSSETETRSDQENGLPASET